MLYQNKFSEVSEQELQVLFNLYSDITRSIDSTLCTLNITLNQLQIPENTFFQQILELPSNQTIISNAQSSLLAIASNQDKNKIVSLFDNIAAGSSGQTEFWLKPIPDTNKQCLRVIYQIVKNEYSLPVEVFLLFQNITHLKYKEKQYNELMDELSTAIPHALVSVRMNITTGECGNIHGQSPLLQENDEIMTIEDFCASAAKIIQGSDNRFAFQRLFNRQNLIRLYKQGKTRLSFDYQRQFDRDNCVWATLFLTMGQNPNTQDIEAIAYVRNNDSKRKKELIIQHLTNDHYDFVAVLDPRTDLLTFYTSATSADYLKDIEPPYTWQNSWHHYIINHCTAKYRTACTNELSLPYIIDQITDNATYTFSFLLKKGSRSLHKSLTFCWLDNSKQFILITAMDNTIIYKQQLQQNKLLQTALLEAEQAYEAKSNFMASVSHDMRTPLNGILGFTALAKETNDPKKINEYIQKIETSGELLKNLINDTLELSKIESGKYELQLENTNILALIEELMVPTRASAQDKQITFVSDVLNLNTTYVIADAAKLKKILLNLISNALKFTPAGGTITLKAETISPAINGYNIKFTVSDTGIGISKDFIPKMYEPFEQEHDSRTSNANGTGLGLSIVKKLVTLMNGTIDVSSEKGVGTSFYLYFHFNNGLAIGKKKQDIPDFLNAIFSNKKILICEDNAFNMEIAKALIAKKNMIPLCAQNGKEAVTIFNKSRTNEISAILMDIHMPVMDGYEATNLIRKCNRSDAQSIPILAMTADAYDEDIKKCLACGMNDHVAKPFDPRILFEKIAVAIMDKENLQSSL